MPNAAASPLLTRREVAELGGVSLAAIDKAIEQGVLRPRRRAGKPYLLARDVGLLVLLHEIEMQLPLAMKRRLRAWLTEPDSQSGGASFHLSKALCVVMTENAAQTIMRAGEYARLRDRYVEQNPAVQGGEPVIRGTRVPVRSIARLVELGESREILREDYPHVPEEAYAVAVLWARANPRRGRPRRPWDEPAAARRQRARPAA